MTELNFWQTMERQMKQQIASKTSDMFIIEKKNPECHVIIVCLIRVCIQFTDYPFFACSTKLCTHSDY